MNRNERFHLEFIPLDIVIEIFQVEDRLVLIRPIGFGDSKVTANVFPLNMIHYCNGLLGFKINSLGNKYFMWQTQCPKPNEGPC